MTTQTSTTSDSGKQTYTLIYAAFIAGLCSIVYELLIASTVSYFLGDSVRYFSVTIGLYMAAMGAGTFMSKFFDSDLLGRFLWAEVCLGILGGLSIPILYFSYSSDMLFIPTYILLTVSIGFLIGLEIPFLTRMMESFQTLKFNIANILSFDYAGALIATLAFPFFLLPVLGNYQSSLVLGLINLSIVAVVIKVFGKHNSGQFIGVKKGLFVALILLGLMLVFSKVALRHWDQSLYTGRIIHSDQSPYQKIVLTQRNDDIRLFLDGNIQFSSVDEYRYHESLVIFPISHMEKEINRVLLLGAGDGLAARELMKYPEIDEIHLVDLDEKIIDLATNNGHLLKLNQGSLLANKVEIIITDAFSHLRNNTEPYDLILLDLPDPNNISLSRLYSKQFYRLVKQNLATDGVLVTQATSPYYAQKAFWSIAKTIKAAGFNTLLPYHVEVPSFGDWGFVMARANDQPFVLERPIVDSRFLTSEMFTVMRTFARDLVSDQIDVNHLDNPVLLTYYLEGWKTYGY